MANPKFNTHYKVKDGQHSLSANTFNSRFEDIDSRIVTLEDAIEVQGQDFNEIINQSLDVLGQGKSELEILESGDKWGEISLPSSVSIAYDGNDRVEVITEFIGGYSKVTTLTYNVDDNIETAVINYKGWQRTETYTYTDGNLTGIVVNEVEL